VKPSLEGGLCTSAFGAGSLDPVVTIHALNDGTTLTFLPKSGQSVFTFAKTVSTTASNNNNTSNNNNNNNNNNNRVKTIQAELRRLNLEREQRLRQLSQIEDPREAELERLLLLEQGEGEEEERRQ